MAEAPQVRGITCGEAPGGFIVRLPCSPRSARCKCNGGQSCLAACMQEPHHRGPSPPSPWPIEDTLKPLGVYTQGLPFSPTHLSPKTSNMARQRERGCEGQEGRRGRTR